MATPPFVCSLRSKAEAGDSEIRDGPFARAVGRVVDGFAGPIGGLAQVVGVILSVVFFPFDLILRLAHLVGIPLLVGIQVLFPIVRPIATLTRLDAVVIASLALLLVVRIMLIPFARAAVRASTRLQVAGPRMKAIQQSHAGDKDAMNRALMQFYKEANLKPASCIGWLLPSVLVLLAFYGAIELLVTRSTVGTFNPRYVAQSSELSQHMGSLQYFVSWQMDLTVPLAEVGWCEALVPYAGLAIALLALTAYSASRLTLGQAASKPAVVTAVSVGTLVFVLPLPAFVLVLRLADSGYLLVQSRLLKRYRSAYARRLGSDPDFHRLVADAYTDAGMTLRRD